MSEKLSRRSRSLNERASRDMETGEPGGTFPTGDLVPGGDRAPGRKLIGRAPRLLFVVWLTIMVTGLVRQAGRLDEPVHLVAAAMLVGYLAWGLAEAPVTFRRSAAPPADVRTLLPYALARLALLAAAVLGPLPWTSVSPALLLPAVVFAAGVGLRQTAIWTLGRFYSHHVVRRDDHAVVSHGVYRVVRHPAYTGMIIAHLGFVAFFLNPLTVAFLVALFAAVVWRIRIEEAVLVTIPGYPAYATGRPRLCPGLW